MKRLLLALSLLAPLASAKDDADKIVLDLLQQDLEAQMRRSPTWASSRGDRRFDHLLSDPGAEARKAWLDDVARRLEAIRAVPPDKLTPANVINAELLAYELERRIARARFQGWQTPITQMGGPHSSLPRLHESLSFETEKHYRDYIARLEAIPAYFAQIRKNMTAGLKAGRTPPQKVMGGVPDQALFHGESRFRRDPTGHALYAPFKNRPKDDALAAEAREVIAKKVVPAFRELGEFLNEKYVPGCRDTTAASALPDGTEFYNFQLESYTTTDMNSEDIHALGLSEVKRIRTEMLEVIVRSDYPHKKKFEGEPDRLLAEFLVYLRGSPRFYFKRAEDLLRAYRDICKRMDAELPRLFGKLPRLTYGVKEMERWLAPTNTTARYYSGSLKNGRPGWFVANTWRLDQRPKYEMVPLALHEAVPGHHLQIALAQEADAVPEWRTLLGYTAFVEGWALYSERLGLEVGGRAGSRGMYEDPYDDFGRLTYEMWRAMRLVVDTGLHARDWTRNQAIHYMLANSALTETNVRREVDRYIAWPGQATAYKIGELKIRDLRARAERKLGERFDIRDFHDALLEDGALPLPILEDKIDRWITERVK